MDTNAAERLARQLIAQHLTPSWSFRWDNAQRRFGVCRFLSSTGGQIGLSRPLVGLNDEPKVRNTILHEIAHAKAGPRHGHDSVWRHEAILLGIAPERCYGEDVDRPQLRYVGTCPSGHVSSRAKRPTRVVSCGKCSPRRFNAAFAIAWRDTHNGNRLIVAGGGLGPVTPLPVQVAAAHAVRVDFSRQAFNKGQRVQIIQGRAAGLGTVEKIGRTNVHIRRDIDQQLWAIPFAMVCPV